MYNLSDLFKKLLSVESSHTLKKKKKLTNNLNIKYCYVIYTIYIIVSYYNLLYFKIK